MPRSSRHRSHKGHKRDARSDSEDGVSSKEKHQKAGELADGSSGTRVLRDKEQEKKKSSANEKNRDWLVEYGKKRKDRADDAVAVDRWIGGDGDDTDRVTEKRSTNEEFGFGDSEKGSKSRGSVAMDSKSEKSRSRHDGPEKNEDLIKQKSGKELTRRESSSSQYKDVKEKERETDKRVHESKHAKHDDSSSRKERSKRDEEDRKKDVESAVALEWQIQEELRNPELEKELEKRVKRRKDEPGDKDKRSGDGRIGGGDKRLISKEDHIKSGSNIIDKQIGGTGREKHREESDKDQRHRDDRSSRGDRDREESDKDQRHRDDRSSRGDRDQKWDGYSYRDEKDKKLRDDRSSRDEALRDDRSSWEEKDYTHRDEKHRYDCSPRGRANDRSNSRHFRDDTRSSESHYNRGKYYDTDHDGGSYNDDHGGKYRDNHGRKRFSDENVSHYDMKSRSLREPHEEVEKTALSMGKFDSDADRVRMEHSRSEKVDCTLSNNLQKYSPTSGSHMKDQIRYPSKQTESIHRRLPSEDRLRFSSYSTRDRAGTSRVIERVSESRSTLKIGSKEESYSSDFVVETNTSRYDRTPRSEANFSPTKITEKSSVDGRFSDRIDYRRSLDIEEEDLKGNSKDARETFRAGSLEKPILDDTRSQTENVTRESTLTGSPSFNQTSYFSGSSSHLPPPPPVRFGIDSPVRCSYDEDGKVHSRERKANGHFRRTGDLSVGRGPGTSWRGAWSSPVANGFLPPPSGFHPNVQRFPGPPLFGRSHMDLSQTSVPFNVHEAADRFSSHGRPFGWRNQMDDSYSPHFQVWNGSNGMFGDESYAYGGPEWNQSRHHHMGNRGLEMGPDMWRGENGNTNMKLHLPQELEYSSHDPPNETWAGQSGNSPSEGPRSEHISDASIGFKRALEAEKIPETARESSHEKTPELIKARHAVPADDVKSSFDEEDSISSSYLSKVEISKDLAPQELYKKCMALLEPGISDDVLIVEVPQIENMENSMEDTKSTGYVISHLFPATTEDAFQKAVSLYMSQTAGTNAKASLSLLACISELNLSSQPSGKDANMNEKDDSFSEGKVNVVENQIHHSPAEQSQPSTALTDNSEEGGNLAMSADAGAASDKKEPQCETGSVVFLEGPQPCESLLSQPCESLPSECRVNLSRIPNSPESTH